MSFRFNPCFIGLASATLGKTRVTVEVEEFQSLFYWISLCDILERSGSMEGLICFNPCFIGLASATRRAFRVRTNGMSVSILVLLD